MPYGKGTNCHGVSESEPGRFDSFDEAFEELLQGPAGTELRRAHILEQLASRVFDGDYEKSKAAMDIPHPRLGHRTASEAAESHEGMLLVKEILAPRTKSKPRGFGAFVHAIREGWRHEFEPLLDLLPAAWGLNGEQFALLLGVPAPSPGDWAEQHVELDDALRARLTRLRRLHESYRSVVKPENYREIWHVVWERDSRFGPRSLWEVYEQEGDAGLDKIEGYFRSLAGPF